MPPDTLTVKTACTRDCQNTCGLLARVERAGGRLTALVGDPDHPFTRGRACHKAMRYVRRVYSPERARFPMLKRNGVWSGITWDEALDLFAHKLRTVIAEDGPEAVFYYQGFGERTALKLLNSYFFNLLGGVSTLRGTLCGGTGQAAQNMDVGERISHDPLDHYNSRSMVLWGRNPASTNISLLAVIKDIRRRGGRTLLIDPVRSRTAALVDRHIAPRPMGDAYLALAAAKRILESGAAHLDFMREHTEGYEGYLELIGSFSADELLRLCDLPAEDVDCLADTLMRFYPTSILLGWGMHRHEYAHLSIRAVDALGALSGILGVPGGGVSQGFEEYGPYDQSFWGHRLNPPRRRLLMPAVGDEILRAADPPIRMIVVTSANPVCSAPDSAKTARAFRSAEFTVYVGHFLDDSADCASLFLPATMFTEEDDVVASYGHNYVAAVNKAVEPPGECRSEFRIFQDLARRFPFARQYCRSTEDWLRDLCAPLRGMGCDLEELKRAPFRLPAPMVPYAGGKFPTPSGKFRCLTELDASLPARQDPDYPYRFITGASHDAICSERTLHGHDALPVLSLAASEVRRTGLADGDAVRVESPLGALTARLRAVEGMRTDVAVTERGGWIKAGHGVNLLTPAVASRAGDGATYYETSVRLRPCFAPGKQGPRILVVENSKDAPGGVFCKELERQGCTLKYCRPHAGDALPSGRGVCDGLLVLGGSASVYDEAAPAWLRAETELMRDFGARELPVAGICLGAQLLSSAYGGRVYRMDRLHSGFTEMTLTAEGEKDPLFAGLRPPLLMEHHHDTFTLPEGAILLASSEHCAHEAFRIGACSYGFQFHPEADAETAARWLSDGAGQAGRDSADGLPATFPALVQDSALFCAVMADNWLKPLLAGSRSISTLKMP